MAPQITTGVLHATQGAGQIGAGIAHQPLEPFREALTALVADLRVTIAAIAAPVHARLAAVPRTPPSGSSSSRTASWPWSPRPATPWLPNALVLGPGPTVVWDPVVAPDRAGACARRARARRSSARSASPGRRVAGAALAETATRPPRAAVAALVEALGSGDVAARRRATLALLGRGPGLTPEGDDLLAGGGGRRRRGGRPVGAAAGAADADDAALGHAARARGGGRRPEAGPRAARPRDEAGADALRELEGLGASSGRAIALGVGAAAAVLGAGGAPRPAARCATLPA